MWIRYPATPPEGPTPTSFRIEHLFYHLPRMSALETDPLTSYRSLAAWRHAGRTQRQPNDLTSGPEEREPYCLPSNSELGSPEREEEHCSSFAGGYYSDGELGDSLPSLRALSASEHTRPTPLASSAATEERENTLLLEKGDFNGLSELSQERNLDSKPNTPSSGYESLSTPVSKKGKIKALAILW